MKTFNIILSLIVLTLLSSCQQENTNLNAIAENYIKAVLAVGNYDKDYVDAYFGPDSLKKLVKKWNPELKEILKFVNDNISSLQRTKTRLKNQKRKHHLLKMLNSVKYRIEILIGKSYDFDEEAEFLYDVKIPKKELKQYDKILDSLNKMLPGNEALSVKYENFKNQFIIPKNKIDTVFKTAIAEGKKRTKEHFKMPKNEKFILEYVSNKSWGGYNWFKGNAESLIQINLDLPIYIDRAITLACHEGYPGHHVYHSLIEQIFVKKMKWIEYSVYPLFSPEAVLSEGTANYGIKVAFPKDERIDFEKNTLFPLAGLDTSRVEKYYKIKDLITKLDFATIDIARLYLNGTINDDKAIELLMKYKLRSKDHAKINLKFFKQYGAYIVTYYIGEDLCKSYVEKRLKGSSDKNLRWKIFNELLTQPLLPSDLQ